MYKRKARLQKRRVISKQKIESPEDEINYFVSY